MKKVAYEGEVQRVELYYLNASLGQFLQMFLLQGSVVAPVSEGIEQGAHFHPLLHLLVQFGEEEGSNGVVAEIEIFKVYVMAGFAYGHEKVIELLLATLQQAHAIAFRNSHPLASEKSHH